MSSSTSTRPDINRGPEILGACGTVFCLAAATVCLRLWVRARITKHVGGDDHFILAAVVATMVEMCVIIPEVHFGAGRHEEYIVPASNITKGLQLNFVSQPLCVINLCLVKLSVGLFLLRLAPSRPYRLFLWGMIIFTVLSVIGNLVSVLSQCKPLAFNWDPSVPGGSCFDPTQMKIGAFVHSSLTFVTDFIFAIVPVAMLWAVKMDLKVKLAVVGVLALGILPSIFSLVKMYFLSKLWTKPGDFLWDSADVTIWTTVEICTAIIAASIPALKPLFKTFLTGPAADPRAQKPSAKTESEAFSEPNSPRPILTHKRSFVQRVLRGSNEYEDSTWNPREEKIMIQKTTDVFVSYEDNADMWV